MSITCSKCSMVFTRKDNLSRHMNRFHSDDSEYTKSVMILKHPFTLIAAGPTSSGKTWLMRKLIKHAKKHIAPTPRRIIWCYSQWQPAYEEMTSYPGLEFIHGIPDELDNPRFLDTTIPNLLILDDLMRSATKDERVSDLYTKGSHHRNLSVICLMQNMYHQAKENRTMSLNSHYLILFNNPRDRQQVAYLSKQMYPGNNGKLVRAYTNATSVLYGYLLLDLKQETPEHDRLKPNAFTFADDKTELSSSPQESQPMENQVEDDVTLQTSSNINISRPNGSPYLNLWDKEDNMISCDDCGVVFDSIHDLQRHIRKWCPEQSEKPALKKMKIDSENNDGESETQDNEDIRENSTYLVFKENARKDNEELFQIKVGKYLDNGMTEKEAVQKADAKLKTQDMERFLNKYKHFIKLSINVEDSTLHKKIMEDIRDMLSNDVLERVAVRRVLSKYRHDLDELFTQDSENELSDESELSDQSESEQESSGDTDSDND